jgi:histone H3/H4
MIHKSKIRKAIKKIGKRVSCEGLLELDKILEKYARENIEKAKRNADFAGRKTILKEDFL